MRLRALPRAMPRCAALIAEARALGVKLAMATTTRRPNIDALFQTTAGAEAAAVFDAIAAGDEVETEDSLSGLRAADGPHRLAVLRHAGG